METVLAPWLAVVDKFSPTWRRRIHGGAFKEHTPTTRDIPLYASRDSVWDHRSRLEIPSPPEQVVLREAVELLGLALCVDADAFMAAVCGDQLEFATSKQFEDGERLTVRLTADSYMQDRRVFDTFFGGWSETIASGEFHQTKEQLLHFQSQYDGRDDYLREHQGRLDITLHLRLTTRGRGGTAASMELLGSIDASQIHVNRVELLVNTIEVGETLLLETFRVVERLHRRGADVEIELELPDHQYDTKALAQWKTVFDLVTRRHRGVYVSCDEPVGSSKWYLLVECSEIDTYGDAMINYIMDLSGSEQSDARLVTACLLVLAHATPSVSSISIRRPLEDEDHDRSIRAKSLAYIMRAGCVDTLTVRDNEWNSDDVEAMALSIVDAERFLEDPNELLGVASAASDLHHSECDDEDKLVSSALRRQEKARQISGDQVQRRLKHLHLSLEGDDQTGSPIFEFVPLVGDSLKELSITSSVRLPVSFIGQVLDSCPRLRRLLVETLENDEGIAALQIEPLSVHSHPLESLSVRVHDASVVQPILHVISQYGARLHELRVSSTKERPRDQHAGPVAQGLPNFFSKPADTLTTLDVSGLSFKDVCGQAVCSPSTSATSFFAKLTSLSLHDVVLEPWIWFELMDALGSNSHPLSRSLRTLRIGLMNKTPDEISRLLQMLQANYFLVNVELTLSTAACDPAEIRPLALITDRVNVHRVKSPMASNCKLALLSCLESKSLHWEPEAIARVFEFAATTEKRRVRIMFHT